MSNVLVLGVGPLPIDGTGRLHAPGIRVWHLAQLISAQRHGVVLGIIEFGDFANSPGAPYQPRQESLGDKLSVCRFKYHSQKTPEALATLHARCRFDCVVSTTDIMNSIAGGIPVHLPLWLDYLGDPFSERQIQAAAYKNDASLLELWKLMANALLLGDRFSVASYPQKYALMGQLGIAGRLNQFNSGTEMIHVLPNCSRVMLDKPARIHSTVKGFLIPADSYVVLWAGGYNTWCDPDTLFRGLELAMKRDSMIYFVSVGGEIPGHDNVTFERFRNLTERSDLTSRFHFVGWVPNDQIPGYYRQADIAINVDLDCYEAEIGTRTRIIDWVEFSVPVVTTALCEPARIFEREGLVYTFHPGDPHSLAGALLDARKDPAKARQRAQDAKAFLDREFAEDIHFSPLLNWVRNPVFAPDRRAPNPAAQRKDAAMVADSRLAELQREFLGRFAVARPEKPRQKSISQRIVDFLVRKK